LESTNRIADYVGFVLRLLVAFGVAFELPLVVFALTSLGVVEPQMLWRKKRYALLVALAVGALLTPPDIFSQVVLGACLLGLYFLALALSSLASRRHRQARDAAPDASSDDAAATPSSAAAAPDAGESDKTA
jgi:sec-independent protein translocase protein TatC